MTQLQKLHNKHGFTLIEVIIVLVILAILAGIALPTMANTVYDVKESICKNCRLELLRYYSIYKVWHQDGTVPLDKFLKGEIKDAKSDVESYNKCPLKGDYYTTDGITISCTEHKAPVGGNNNTPDEPEEPAKPTVPGTDIPLLGSGWPDVPMFDENGNYSFKAGEVFEHKGNYYVITKDTTIYKTNASGGPDPVLGWDFMERFTGVKWNSSSELTGGQLENVRAGDLYIGNGGDTYVFTPNSGGWGSMPPENYPNQWFKVK